MSEQKNFSWVATHKGIVEYLKGMENKQEELTGLLKTVGISINNDQSAPEKFIELKEIDPFTFFMFIYKHGDVKRLKILQAIALELKLPVPEDTAGIPSVFATNVLMFPPKYERKQNEIKRLWKLFYSAISGKITDEQYLDSLKIFSVGKTKLSAGLFYIDPEKYFPINGPSIPYLKKILKIKTEYNSFSGYMDILAQVKEKINKPFYEISHDAWVITNPPAPGGIPEPINYWIFQANPKIYNVEKALTDGALGSWNITRHKKEIKKGDKGIIWVTGKNPGCYAFFEVASNVEKAFDLPAEMEYYIKETKNEKSSRALINITGNLSSNPITILEVKRHPELRNLNVGKQGTNFKLTEEEFLMFKKLAESVTPKKYWLYAPGPGAKYWDEFREEGIMAIGGDELGDLMNYKDIKEIAAKLQEEENTTSNKMNDSLCLFEVKERISKGDVVIVKKGIQALLGYGVVTSDYYFDDERERYKNCRKVSWELNGEWKTEFKLVVKTLTDITKYPTEHPDYKTYYERLMAIMTDPNYKPYSSHVNPPSYPLNTIFYGPPGTGKTYEAIRRAASIVENREFPDYNEALKKFQEHLGERIEFITFHQNYSYEDFIQGLRPDTNNVSDLIFEKKDGIFKKLAKRALENLKLSKKDPAEAAKESLFDIGLKKFIDEVEEKEENFRINNSAYIMGVDEESFRYTGEGWEKHAMGLRMKFSDLREFYNNNVKKRRDIRDLTTVSGLAKQHATYYFLVFEKIKKLIPSKPEVPKPVQCENHVMLIDEINRANISRVFGELITLIEEDKRFGGDIPLTSRLPSGEEFCVPSNLYIIGTMNTADKSIALLDIALRRRFEFEPLYPKYEIDGEPINEPEILRKMNDIIIESKGHDFQIGHSFFMGIEFNLVKQMNKKVIPLLLEYFMNDKDAVKDILDKAGLILEQGSWPIKITGKK